MKTVGLYLPRDTHVNFNPKEFSEIISDIRNPIYLVFEPQKKSFGLAKSGEVFTNSKDAGSGSLLLLALLPAIYPEWLGDRGFLETHNLRFAYVGGAMARGITSSNMVIELAKAGMLGFLGSAGMKLEKLENELKLLSRTLSPHGLSWGANLIHTPDNPSLEENIIDLYLKYGVNRVSAAAFLGITSAVARFSAKGLYRDKNGNIKRKNYVFAKVSHPEIAKYFLSPIPESILKDLVSCGKITDEEAELAQQIPIAEDIDVEGDSEGHTDNRPLNVLFPTILILCRKLSEKYGYRNRIRLGAAGGIGTPQAVASAFALGASHIVVGSVHQSAVEAGTSKEVKELLAKADIADVMMTASADMFEMGVKVQVLKRGSMMGVRGNLLYDVYKRYDSLEDIPEKIRKDIEKSILRASIEDIWEEIIKYFTSVEPEQISLSEINPKHKMALIFRWYIGNSSRWPILGNTERLMDYQIWCGPAMGAFNEWVKATFLEIPQNRSVRQIALNLMEGGAVITRAQQLRTYGLPVQEDVFMYRPEPLDV